jgi:hypothetical protein
VHISDAMIIITIIIIMIRIQKGNFPAHGSMKSRAEARFTIAFVHTRWSRYPPSPWTGNV